MSLEVLINDNYKKLNENDLHILNYILSNAAYCIGLNIADLAKLCNVSSASILRTAKKLGFSGFSEFKYYLKSTTDKTTPPTKQNTITSLYQDIDQTIKVFQENNRTAIVYQLIQEAKNLYAYGTGHGQRLMLQEFSRCLLNMNKNLIILPAYTEFEIASNNFHPDDLVFVVSLSGNMKSLKETIVNLGVRNVPLISITHFNNNELASFTRYNFYYQTSNINQQDHLKQSSYFTLHILLHMIYEGFSQWSQDEQRLI